MYKNIEWQQHNNKNRIFQPLFDRRENLYEFVFNSPSSKLQIAQGTKDRDIYVCILIPISLRNFQLNERTWNM